MGTDESDCIEALLRAADELEKSPTKAEYEGLGITPASATIIQTIGSWNEAKSRAGLETFTRAASGGNARTTETRLGRDSGRYGLGGTVRTAALVL